MSKSKMMIIGILATVLFAMMSYIWLEQKGDVMLMKHWMELIIMEAFIQQILFLLSGKKISN